MAVLGQADPGIQTGTWIGILGGFPNQPVAFAKPSIATPFVVNAFFSPNVKLLASTESTVPRVDLYSL